MCNKAKRKPAPKENFPQIYHRLSITAIIEDVWVHWSFWVINKLVIFLILSELNVSKIVTSGERKSLKSESKLMELNVGTFLLIILLGCRGC